jgi:hypothetical protein
MFEGCNIFGESSMHFRHLDGTFQGPSSPSADLETWLSGSLNLMAGRLVLGGRENCGCSDTAPGVASQ